jgi:hypothetical protein
MNGMALAYGALPLDGLRELASSHSKGRKRLAHRKYPSWLGKRREGRRYERSYKCKRTPQRWTYGANPSQRKEGPQSHKNRLRRVVPGKENPIKSYIT